MPDQDRYGLSLSTASSEAAKAYRDCERFAHHYCEDWWFLSNYGWSLTENGEAAKGRAITERAFDKRRKNARQDRALTNGAPVRPDVFIDR